MLDSSIFSVVQLIVLVIFLTGCTPRETPAPPLNQSDSPVEADLVIANPIESSPISVKTITVQVATFTYPNQPSENFTHDEYTYLQVDVTLQATEEIPVGVQAWLLSEQGELFSVGSLDSMPDRAAPLTSTVLKAGEETISIYFRGSDIVQAEIVTPYHFSLRLFDIDGLLVLETEAVITTLDHTNFSAGDRRGA